MSKTYTVTRTGRGMQAGYAIWDVQNALYVDGFKGTVYATYDDAMTALAAQEAADLVPRVRAGVKAHGPASGRVYPYQQRRFA